MSEQGPEPVTGDELGPIGCLAVEFPAGGITGAGFDVLVDLVDRDVIRVLDLEFVAKRPDGTVESVAVTDFRATDGFDPAILDGAAPASWPTATSRQKICSTHSTPPNPTDRDAVEKGTHTVGLFRTAAKVGLASSVHGRVQRRQRSRWAEQHQPTAPQPATPASFPAAPGADVGDKLAHLKQLGELRDSGVLTDAEFEIQKARILHA